MKSTSASASRPAAAPAAADNKIDRGKIAHPAWLIVGILMIAMNLRAPFTGAGPLLDVIRTHLHLSIPEAGMMITLPLLTFAAVSPFSAALAARYGLERALFAALGLIAAGILLRSAGPVWSLYAGTAIIGCGIAIGNVLLPSLLKRDFPNSIAKLTAIYAITMGGAAALASILVVPLSQYGGWPFALGVFIVLPLVSAVAWLPQLRNRTAPSDAHAAVATAAQSSSVWHSALAWQVTLFLGLNSFVYYVATAWLPAILADAGYSAAAAGNLHGLMQLATALPGLLLIPLVGRMKDQRLIACAMGLLALAALLGLLAAPAWAALWTALFGFGAGATLILGLAFVSLRASNPQQAAALSGMAQCVGYLLAAAGPALVGLMRDALGNWNAILLMCAALCGLIAVLGLFAGRARHIGGGPL